MKGEVVRDGANEEGMKRVVLNIIDNRSVVSVGSSGMEGFIVGREFCYIPSRLSNSLCCQ